MNTYMILELYEKSEFVFAEIIHIHIYISIYIYIYIRVHYGVCVCECMCSPTPTDYGIILEIRFFLRLEETVVKEYIYICINMYIHIYI